MIIEFDTYVKLNESRDIDPYGEEWWYDDIKIKIGGTVQCINTCTTEGIRVENGEKYEVVDLSKDEEEYFIVIKGKADLIKADFFKYYHKNELLDEYEQDDEIIKYDGIIPVWWPKRIFININEQ